MHSLVADLPRTKEITYRPQTILLRIQVATCDGEKDRWANVLGQRIPKHRGKEVTHPLWVGSAMGRLECDQTTYHADWKRVATIDVDVTCTLEAVSL